MWKETRMAGGRRCGRPCNAPVRSSRRIGGGYTILSSKSIPKWKMMKASTVMSTAVFSLFSKIFCSMAVLLAWNCSVE
jgi:hypothetical protein